MKTEKNIEKKIPFKIPTEYLLLIISGILLLIGIVIFYITPESMPIDKFQTPVLSFLAAICVAAIGNIIIGFIQKGVSREASRALQNPMKELDNAVEKLTQIQEFYEAGVVGIFPNRSAAMQHFYAEIEREEKTINFVGTSLLGTIDPTYEDEDKLKFHELLLRKRQNGVKIRALLMHPAYGEFRERVENRERAAVARDIQRTLRYFVNNFSKEIKESHEISQNELSEKQEEYLEFQNIRLYPGVVTSYAIITSRSMLVNPSTLHGPVFDNFTFIIEDKLDPNSIFKKFRKNHFFEPWRSEKTIRLNSSIYDSLLNIDFSKREYRFKEGNWPATIPQEESIHQELYNNSLDEEIAEKYEK